MERILLVIRAGTVEAARQAMTAALEAAAGPEALSFALAVQEEHPDTAFSSADVVRVAAACEDPWPRLKQLWQGETRLLMLPQGTQFCPGWDKSLRRALRLCQNDRAVLTGYLPGPASPVQAVAPVAAKGFLPDDRLRLWPGTALHYARHPERCGFLHPDFLFGPAAFFLELADGSAPRSLAAFVGRWPLYTLHIPCLKSAENPAPMDIRLPEGSEAHRFCVQWGLDAHAGTVSPRAYCGLTSADLTVETRFPLKLRLRELFHGLDPAASRLEPLMVTIPGVQPVNEAEREAERAAFRRLVSLRDKRLLTLAGSEALHGVRLIDPQARQLTRACEPPIPAGAISVRERFQYGKLFTLQYAAGQLSRASHLMWVDAGLLRCPVYPRSALAWPLLCTAKITLAEVDGHPDLSCLVVPRQLMEPLCRALAQSIETDLAAGRLRTCEAALQQLMGQHPDWFQTFPLPGAGELPFLLMASQVG